jgi:hypothetical protein
VGGAALLALALGPVQPAHAARFIAGNDSGILGYFTSEKPKRFIQLEVTGLDNEFESFAGLDVRPQTGKLWALTDELGEYRVYQVKLDVADRSAEVVKRGGPLTINGVDENNVGFSFDPVSDEMRLVENLSDANRTLDADTFDIGEETDLAYAVGDDNEGTEPGVQALGYTNQAKGADRSKLYGIDEHTDSLVRIKPPAGGVLQTVGPLDVNTTYGFDLDIAAGGRAYATLRVNQNRLYEVDLKTGEADHLGVIGDLEGGIIPGYGRPYSLAVVSKRLVG